MLANCVSAVLLNWKRPYHIPRIVDHLLSHDFVGEVLVWDNSGQLEIPARENVRILHSERNRYTYGRFLAAKKARYGTVFVQDDDVVVSEIATLYGRFSEHRQSITAGLPVDASSRHYKHYHAFKTPWIELGFGSFFLQPWMRVFEHWTRKYGEDDLLDRKADKIFAILFGKHDPVLANPLRLTGPDGKESGRDKNALYKQTGFHQMNKEVVRKALDVRNNLRTAARA